MCLVCRETPLPLKGCPETIPGMFHLRRVLFLKPPMVEFHFRNQRARRVSAVGVVLQMSFGVSLGVLVLQNYRGIHVRVSLTKSSGQWFCKPPKIFFFAVVL